MSDKLVVGSKLNALSSTKNNDSVTGIRVLVSDDLNYFAGNESGEVLELECPWGTQQIADNLLAQYKGYKYQPYEADGASLDPAVEIGDAVVVGRVYGGLFKEELKFGAIPKSTFSAPQSKQINHEFPYTSKRERKINRSVKEVKTEITVQAGKIEAEIKEREKLDGQVSENSTKITQNTNSISAEVKAREELGGTVTEQGTKISQNAESITAEVKAREELSASVDGIGQTVTEHSTSIKANTEGLAAEVSERETLAGVVSENKTSIAQQADSIAAKVSKTGGTSSSFSWEMLSDGMSWYANSQLIFSLSESGGEFTGKVVAKSGEIGGFTLADGRLYTGDGSWSHCEPGEIAITPDGINFSEQFFVRANGELTAKKGFIGDWEISDGLRTGNGSWAHCEPGEIYVGPEGINISENCYIDAQGNLTAYSGRFEGTVFASSIAYGGGSSGYLNGGALTEGSVFGGAGGQLASNTITGGLSGNIDLETIIGGDGGNIAYETLSVDNVNAGFNSNLAQVYTNQDAIAANAVIVGAHGTKIGDLENRLNGTTEATNIKAALLGCSGTFTMPVGSHFNYRGHAVKWVQIDPKTYAMCYTV